MANAAGAEPVGRGDPRPALPRDRASSGTSGPRRRDARLPPGSGLVQLRELLEPPGATRWPRAARARVQAPGTVPRVASRARGHSAMSRARSATSRRSARRIALHGAEVVERAERLLPCSPSRPPAAPSAPASGRRRIRPLEPVDVRARRPPGARGSARTSAARRRAEGRPQQREQAIARRRRGERQVPPRPRPGCRATRGRGQSGPAAGRVAQGHGDLVGRAPAASRRAISRRSTRPRRALPPLRSSTRLPSEAIGSRAGSAKPRASAKRSGLSVLAGFAATAVP